MKNVLFVIFISALTWHCQYASKGVKKNQEKTVEDASKLFEEIIVGLERNIKIYFTLGSPELAQYEFSVEIAFNDGKLNDLLKSSKKIKTNKSYLFERELEIEHSTHQRDFAKISFRFSTPAAMLDSRFKKGIPVNNIAFYVDDKTKYNCYPLQEHEWKINSAAGLVFLIQRGSV